MLRHLGINVTVTCRKQEALQQLRANRETHTKLVSEARAAYVERAKLVLAHRLDELKSGKAVGLEFSLVLPRDYTEYYDTVIAMLESSVDDTIKLGADEYHRLMQDSWDWTMEFVGSNAVYSAGTRDWAASKGYNV